MFADGGICVIINWNGTLEANEWICQDTEIKLKNQNNVRNKKNCVAKIIPLKLTEWNEYLSNYSENTNVISCVCMCDFFSRLNLRIWANVKKKTKKILIKKSVSNPLIIIQCQLANATKRETKTKISLQFDRDIFRKFACVESLSLSICIPLHYSSNQWSK